MNRFQPFLSLAMLPLACSAGPPRVEDPPATSTHDAAVDDSQAMRDALATPPIEPFRCDPTAAISLILDQRSSFPVPEGAKEARFCVHVDASPQSWGVFMVNGGRARGLTSGVELNVYETSGAPVATSYDVSVGKEDPETFASLEVTRSTGDLLVVAHATTGKLTPGLGVSYLFPYE